MPGPHFIAGPFDMSLARAARGLYLGLAGSTVSLTSVTSHSRSGSTAERWNRWLSRHWKRARPSVVRSSDKSLPPGGAAGPPRPQIGIIHRRAVAIGAGDLDRPLHLAIDVAAAVRVLAEMAIDALHPELDIDRFEMDGLFELLRVVVGDDLVAVVEQIPLRSCLKTARKFQPWP